MRARALHEAVQWFALLGGALVWTGQFVIGMGMSFATCDVVGSQWSIDQSDWEIALTASAGFIALLALAASVWLYVRLRHVGSEPPAGRHVFFAYASIPANVLFLGIILLSGIMSLYHLPCNQA